MNADPESLRFGGFEIRAAERVLRVQERRGSN